MLKSAIVEMWFNWKYIVGTALLAGLLTCGNWWTGIQVAIETTWVFIGIKVAVASIVTSGIFFFYVRFWEDLAVMKKSEEFGKVAQSYESSFNWLFSVDVLMFVSLSCDLYIVFWKDVLLVQSISNGCFVAATICLFIFMLSLYGTVFRQLRTFKGIGTRTAQAPTEEAGADSSNEQAR